MNRRFDHSAPRWGVFTVLTLAAWFAVTRPTLQAQEVVIQALSRNGVLTWTNASVGGACRVEWAPAIQTPWQRSWETLVDIPITNLVTERAVPMLYRVVSYPLPVPVITDVTAAAAFAVVTNRQGDASFIILDVRTPSEYSAGHIKTVLNVNFYSVAFGETLAKLDRRKTYLVYCASGNRSRQAVQVMRSLNFMQVYNMTQGYSTFAALPGAGPYLE